MFKNVTPKLDVVKMEEAILQMWQEKDIFHKSVNQREGGPKYVFYEGPPTANGHPGVHHVLARSFKDMFPRYKTMRGFQCIRRGGWDTHGLPVEIEVEKKLGFTNKQQIEDYGIDKFNELCRESAFSYIQEWEKMTDRMAYWADMETAYVTYKNSYIESIWWILKNFWEKDLLYQGFKVVPYCPRCGTPLSDHEVALGYEDAEDPSVFVRMRLIDEPDTSLLIWTTTPWTLPSNAAVAAHPDVTYVVLERVLEDGQKEKLILAEALVEKIFGEEPYTIVKNMTGKELEGKKYTPLYNFIALDKAAHFVALADYVSTEDGTGLVHTAPAYGAEDMLLGNAVGLPVIQAVGPDGKFLPEVTPWAGIFIKDADPSIMDDLKRRGLLFRRGTIVHTYPFCWRCKTPLLYFARKTWYLRTSRLKDRLVALNDTINWYPNHIKNGRFGNWLSNNIDWALGRERYWGTPLPVWQCQDCGKQECNGSVEELAKKSGRDLTDLDLHRPHVDNVHYKCPDCQGIMQRVPELIDVWFDSGSMPYAQWHYPFENQQEFKEQFPADYICEAVDQTRGWFYSLHAISTLLNDDVCFKNVICLGLILDADGYKMSKSRGNVVSPWEILDVHGADAFRWYLYTASPAGQERRFSPELVGEVIRSFTLTLWNTYSFFVNYANLDGWKPEKGARIEYSSLDMWLRSALQTLVRDVTNAYENYDSLGATRPVEAFVDQLSNWFLRRSRRRFWKTESDADKQAAYATLYEALVTVSKLLTPAMPFLAEELYQNLVLSFDPSAPESVHLADWPEADSAVIDENLNREMALVMKLASLGHAARNKANRKVRQPLAECAFSLGSAEEGRILARYADILTDELNVKKVRALNAAGEAVSYSLNPLPKQLGQKYGPKFPAIRQAVQDLKPEESARLLLEGKSVALHVGDETYELLPDEIEVRATAREGYAVANDGATLAALVTELNEDLILEGMAREVVRRVQDLRKTAGLEISDRIQVNTTATPTLAKAIETYRDYICSETLTVKMAADNPMADMAVDTDTFDGETLTVGLKKA